MTHESILIRTKSPQGILETSSRLNESLLIRLCEGGWIPDELIRAGIRRLCRERLSEEQAARAQSRELRFRERPRVWQEGPIALATEKANEQHYEVPPEFFELVLGRYLKYSCAWWHEGEGSLDRAEAAMLELTCERAAIADGMRILELGCGWGSLTLWMAVRFPACTIVAVSNSVPQRNWILARARERGLSNIEVTTADINSFEPVGQFDRVVSVEMFEHVRNHRALFHRIQQWLKPQGTLFAHVFCHRDLAYPFESEEKSDWMARHFFSGGMMPSYDLFLSCQNSLLLENRWWTSGEHYQKTAETWLARLDAKREAVLALFQRTYSPGEARRVVQRWRMFFMAVSELFGLDRGAQWGVGHYLFRNPT